MPTRRTTKKAPGKKPAGLEEGDWLPAFKDLFWDVDEPPAISEDLDKKRLKRSAGVAQDTLRVWYQSTRYGTLRFSREYRGASAFTVLDVLERVHEFYMEVVPKDEAAEIKACVRSGKIFDGWDYIHEYLLPDPRGPLHMLPPDEQGHIRPSWTDARCSALLKVYGIDKLGTSRNLWEAVAALLRSYERRKEPFPVFPPRKKEPCVRRWLLGDAVIFEGLCVWTPPTRRVLEVEVWLGS